MGNFRPSCAEFSGPEAGLKVDQRDGKGRFHGSSAHCNGRLSKGYEILTVKQSSATNHQADERSNETDPCCKR